MTGNESSRLLATANPRRKHVPTTFNLTRRQQFRTNWRQSLSMTGFASESQAVIMSHRSPEENSACPTNDAAATTSLKTDDTASASVAQLTSSSQLTTFLQRPP
ncbi:hypothetical protein JDV02_004581 [Purpureocillium takamizusanense]|uniref:Uncharacterized protein n=1 Tax=Purpureocillium takamizusanense TaxID=2060973 RepID=A0A9Q8QGN9_9HYPO|nr:uncharacterized protein JDV02_004581 [Purpureocillium takamizusanense]UNI18307.1 hypothetical protein JDV02_004581 [Purpureocillium takamizusanense]